MSAHAALRAPDLPGHTHLQHLGSGGYAEVFLYQQDITELKVAVKVLNADSLDEAVQRQFTAEAGTMAQLSGHPFIVSVMSASITDDGRPYIVMTYYPKPNLSVRARREHFSVPDVLKIGVQISSAVETAHRAGILHRDIKPANILTGQYGDPGLTDFGIAATTAETTTTAEGMSVPWSPPEVVFGQSDGDVRSDVYALGATLWHLLSGRSPYEQPGGDNSHLALMRRVQADPVPAVRRDDVPEGLQRLLRQALAKSADGRPQSALALARGLQAVEQELRLPRTPIVVPDDVGPTATKVGDDDEHHATVVRAARVVQAQPGERALPARTSSRGPVTGAAELDDLPTSARAAVIAPPPGAVPAQAPPRVTGSRGGDAAREPRARVRAPAEPAPEKTTQRAAAPSTPAAGPYPDVVARPSEPAAAGSRTTKTVAAVAAALVLLAGGGVALTLGSAGEDDPAPDAAPDASEAQDAVPAGSGLAPGTPELTTERAADGVVRFVIAYGDPQPGDTFRWTNSGAGEPASGSVEVPVVELAAPACISVRAVRSSGLASPPSAPACAS